MTGRDASGGQAYGEQQARGYEDDPEHTLFQWHLMENASRAFLDAVRKSMRHIRAAIGTATINPELLTAAERIQYEGYQRREEANAAVFALAKDNVAIKEIVRRTGHSRGLVRHILRGQRDDVFRVRESSLEVHLPWLDAQWAAGHRNAAELWRRLKARDFLRLPAGRLRVGNAPTAGR